MVFPSWGAFLNIPTIVDYSGNKTSPYFLIAWSPRVLLGKSMWTLFLEFWYILNFLMCSGICRKPEWRETKLCFQKQKPPNQKETHFVWEVIWQFDWAARPKYQSSEVTCLSAHTWPFLLKYTCFTTRAPFLPCSACDPMENGLWHSGENQRDSIALCGDPFCRSSYEKQILEREKNSCTWWFRGNQLAWSG